MTDSLTTVFFPGRLGPISASDAAPSCLARLEAHNGTAEGGKSKTTIISLSAIEDELRSMGIQKPDDRGVGPDWYCVEPTTRKICQHPGLQLSQLGGTIPSW